MRKTSIQINLSALLEKIIRAIQILITEGLYLLIVRIRIKYFQGSSIGFDYILWLRKNCLSREKILRIKREVKAFKYTPLISIVMPVNNIEIKWLKKAIISMFDQLYPNWELCIADDYSANRHIHKLLKYYHKKDLRIKAKYISQNLGISLATNQAIFLASGEFIGLLGQDDKLSPDALFEVVNLLQKNPEVDMIYSDEDRITTSEKRYEPFFKPDWSPDLFLSQMYTRRFGVYRKSIVDKIGGFRKGYEDSQDYDFVLRFTENTEKIFHISKILYHWRKVLDFASNKYETNDSDAASIKALNSALERRGIKGTVEKGIMNNTFRIKRQIINNPLVSIIIPTKDKLEYLEKCIESIKKITQYKNYEILIVDNDSIERKTMDYLHSINGNNCCRVLHYSGSYSFSAINNYAASKANGEFLLFLNNDTEVISAEWLGAMLEIAQRKETGAVGAKLIFENNTIQHAGVLLGFGGIASHAFYKLPADCNLYFNNLHVIRNYSAVTAACMMVRKSLFCDLGGFDEVNLPICYNDVDFCLRLRGKGYFNVFTPYAVLHHYESISRAVEIDVNESCYMMSRWKDILEDDPYYNTNLTRNKEDFGLKI